MTLRAGTWTVLFTDVVGSTDQRVRLGDAAVDQMLREHDAVVARALAAHGGELVEGTGDGAMCAFAGAADALAAAVAIQQHLERRNRDAPEQVRVRVGVSLGDLAFEDGGLHGLAAHEAARVCAAAEAGEILVSDVVRTVAGSRADCELVPRGELELKGLPQPVRLWRARWAPAPEPEQLPFPPLLESRQALAFSGREGELTTVLDAWKDASGGSRRCVVVSGEPGIGKTRLVAEAGRVAHRDGAVVLYGRCDEELGVPFQPFAEALDGYVARADELIVGRWPGDLARLAPQLRDQVRNTPPPSHSGGTRRRSYAGCRGSRRRTGSGSRSGPGFTPVKSKWQTVASLASLCTSLPGSRPRRAPGKCWSHVPSSIWLPDRDLHSPIEANTSSRAFRVRGDCSQSRADLRSERLLVQPWISILQRRFPRCLSMSYSLEQLP